MQPSEEWIRAVNDRLLWDGIWEDSCRTFSCGFTGAHPRGVYEALDDAWAAFGGEPKLIIISWAVGKMLLTRNHRDWNNTTNGRLPDDYPFHRDLEGERNHMLEKGYFGKYRGALVVASIYTEVFEEYGILASTDNPREIEYDGSNCIRLLWT